MKKHSKLQNSGILFELLTRKITSDILSGKESPAVDIIKKYFVKTELGKEYKLYETLFKNKNLTEGKANMILSEVLETSKKLNKPLLKKLKYNLVKEIKNSYNLEEFFKTKLSNYKNHAAFHNLMELQVTEDKNVNDVIENKLTILEHLTYKSKKVEDDELVEEFKALDKNTRILSYQIMSEKFNTKHSDLNENQKIILKEYINSVDNTPKLREFFNKKLNEIKGKIVELNGKTKNEISKIKINEVISLMKEIDKNSKVKDDDLINLMQYCDLLEELQTANK